jgi:hypothetical protein
VEQSQRTTPGSATKLKATKKRKKKTMTRLKKIHPAVATWLITLAIGPLTTQVVIAKPKNLCTPQTCGTKTCQYRGKT